YNTHAKRGGGETADAADLKSAGGDSVWVRIPPALHNVRIEAPPCLPAGLFVSPPHGAVKVQYNQARSEEHTSELQSRENLVCPLHESPLFPYTTLFRSYNTHAKRGGGETADAADLKSAGGDSVWVRIPPALHNVRIEAPPCLPAGLFVSPPHGAVKVQYNQA